MALITIDDIERLSPVFRDAKGHRLAERLMRLTGIDRLSEIYGRHEDLTGPEFISAFLEDLGVSYRVSGIEKLDSVVKGPFITISNHPFGALDGLILMDLFGHLREDYKVMANQFLSIARTIADNLISVVPATDDSRGVAKESLSGIRQALAHVRAGHPLGIFPAGAVSDFHTQGFSVRDREWQPSALRLIKRLQVPVVPVRFLDKNSLFFYFLGLFSWKIRTLRLPKEILNKAGKTIHLSVGDAIGVETQNQCPDEWYGAMLRKTVYQL